MAARAVLFDVDGSLLDVLANQRDVWHAWADRHGLDRGLVYECATRSVPLETFARVAPHIDPLDCLAALHDLEDEDARSGTYRAFAGARELLCDLPAGRWAVVTSNYAHRVAIRFERLGLPVPPLIIDAAAVGRGKPDPEGYIAAASRLGVAPENCLVCEDGDAGVRAALSAGMSVWAINAGAANADAHRRYRTLEDAADGIRAWVDRA